MGERMRFYVDLKKADAAGCFLCIQYPPGFTRPTGISAEGQAVVLWYREDGHTWEVDAVMTPGEAGYMAKPDPATKRAIETGIGREAYLRDRFPRFGKTNPERIECEFWKYMIRTGEIPYRVRKYFDDEGSSNHSCPVPGVERRTGAMFCFDRLGQSRTTLPDGRVVCVGGEYDDSYDPDFHIYNDVVALGLGDAVEIYGYPSKVFPPTDFHTATLVGKTLYLIGGLGYTEDWKQEPTRVRALDLETFRMETVSGKGEGPGWLFQHEAQLAPDGGSIRVRGGIVKDSRDTRRDNFDEYSLDLKTGAWRKLTDRRWSQFRVLFVDRKVDLYLIRKQEANGRPVFKFIQDFLPFPSNEVVEDGERDLSKRTAVVDGVALLAESHRGGVKLTVQGELPRQRIDELLAGIGRLLEEHASSPVQTERLR